MAAEYSRNESVPRAVRRVRLDLGADEELAAIGLRHVHVELRRDEDDVEERLHRLGDERLKDVRRDREPHADEPADERRPARGGAHDRRTRPGPGSSRPQ